MTEQRKQRIETELALLQKSKWGWSDIMEYYECASDKANKIRKRVASSGGQAPYDPHKVLSAKVIEIEDSSTPEREIYKRRIELEGVNPEDAPYQIDAPAPKPEPETAVRAESPFDQSFFDDIPDYDPLMEEGTDNG